MVAQEPTKQKRRRRCERCGELGALPVVYGLVASFDSADDEPTIFAGCALPEPAPDRVCRPCAGVLGLL